ncbi:diguanylate cyclase [Citrobacter amalonaticus]|uniref:diguanylate cyclase n=1 Tax=Citrobacter amalonaticus TaxID=35703 RepID=A0A2S4RQ95_CITAM|nr:sensor domain-containing diguanylate cyclase [Citrobacter amalonaticus]POT55350.1 diguanylate cyclase [Citrobacter amalonaticus]POT69033.1 diguanylate cyclase [Citrobacter amalonaticus]POU59260.1 diguanylate cyclase [Citrobacter amalonaticus]POV03421.1 diguanylate cyclase [Citrobacter amalonaticus]
MASYSRKLSFTTPILVSFTGILISFILIAVFITFTQRKDFLDDYHGINKNFTHNLAVNYTESLLRENDYILGRAATFFSRNDQLNQTVNVNPEEGLNTLMQLQTLMPSVSSISLADTKGNYLRAPEVLSDESSHTFDAKTRPWFISQAEASTFSSYTSPYMDHFTHNPTVTLYKPVISPEGKLKGTIAFHLDLTSIGYTLRQMVAPVQGEFFVVDRHGNVMLHPDTGMLFKRYVSEAIMHKMTSGEGHLYDKESDDWYYYYSFTNPDWFVIYRVANTTLVGLTRHETDIVLWGFALAAIVIVLFGLYLRHASRTVLMNIFNAIKTGDVQRAPRLEAMLSKAIETNKERELTYVRQATIDALTGCKNRRAFDSDISTLMNDHQPFALALVDIDNFKSINDTWGHLNGDIVLRNVAREGIAVMQPQGISVYRYGGEEFAILFPAGHLHAADSLLESWRIQVAQRTWREEGLHVTFSAGVGEWNLETLEQLVINVDEALYKAKKQGKNRILRVKTH